MCCTLCNCFEQFLYFYPKTSYIAWIISWNPKMRWFKWVVVGGFDLIFHLSVPSMAKTVLFSQKGNTYRNDDFYPKTEKMIQTLTKYYFILTLAGSVIYGFVPFMVVGFCKARKTYTLSMWTLHYNNVWWVSIWKWAINERKILYFELKFRRLPFELDSSARYTGVNIVQSMSCWTGTTILITIISIYFGIILYIRAFLRDIAFFFAEIDELTRTGDTLLVFEKLKSLISFHVGILEWVILIILIHFEIIECKYCF